MTITVFAQVTINEDEPKALARYFEITTPLLERAGARILRRFRIVDTIVGKPGARTVVVVEYPNRAAVDAVFGSAEYSRAIPWRDRAFSDYRVSVCAPDEGPDARVQDSVLS